MTHKYVAVTNVGAKFEQCCNSIKEGMEIHQKLLDSGWQIQRYEVFEMEDGPEIQMQANLH